MKDRKELKNIMNDLWYTLREDYATFEIFSADFEKYLDVSVELLKSLPEEQRLNHLLPIAHDDESGRNIAYSLITTISTCRDNFIDRSTKELDHLLMAAVTAFSTPNVPSLWNDLYAAVEHYKANKLK